MEEKKNEIILFKKLEYLEKTIKLIDIANRIDERLEGNDAKGILKVIGDYSKALDLLDDYDHRTLRSNDRVCKYRKSSEEERYSKHLNKDKEDSTKI